MSQDTIICHSFPAWDTPYIKSTIELMTRLTNENRVIMVDYHYTWKDVFTSAFAPKKRILGFMTRWRKIQTIAGYIEVYNSLPVIPTNWINIKGLLKLVNSLNRLVLKRTVQQVIKKVGHHEAILINAFNPAFGLLSQDLWKVKKTFYYCYDEISGTSWAGKHGPSYEEAFAQQVNGVICTSEQLQKDKSKFNSNCHLVPNGVNLDIFKTPAPSKGSTYSIGYVGAVDNRIDFELINSLATAMPRYRIHIYGPVKTEMPTMKDNILFYGTIPQEDLPKLISELDACLIPFVKNKLTAAIYPLKINEYLAMGKPVISTEFADLSDFGRHISTGENTSHFIEQTRKELKYNNRLKAQKRTRFAQKNSWKNRALEFQEIVQRTTIPTQ